DPGLGCVLLGGGACGHQGLLVIRRKPDAKAFALNGDAFLEDKVKRVELDFGVELFLELVDDGSMQQGFSAAQQDVGSDADGGEDHDRCDGQPKDPAFPAGLT